MRFYNFSKQDHMYYICNCYVYLFFLMVNFLVIGTRLGNFVLGGLEKLYC